MTSSKAIHLYQPNSKKWVKAGELLAGRGACACIVLPRQEILVAGGYTETGPLQTVEMAIDNMRVTVMM